MANEDGASLSVIDAATNTVVTSVKGVEGPHNVQVSPDSRTVWAVSGHDSMAVMLDAGTLALHGVVPTGAAPAHVIVTLDGKTTYTTNGADGTVTAIDAATMKPLATIPVGEGPHGLRPSPDGRWIYVANVSGNTLSVIDTSANTKVADIEVGKAPAQVAFSPDGRFVYASINAEDALVKVDVQTREVVGRVMVGDGPIQTYVSPDNRYVLVANQGTKERPGTTVSVIDTTSFTVARTVETGQGAHGVVVDPSSRHAYVTNLYGNDVAVLDLNELRVVGRIPVGDKPNGISFSTVPVSEQAPVTIELPEGQGIGDQGHGGDGH
ncbi:cytochrome D1 domain-containing protein [Intrasporangium calvum]|uniref:YVTN family beta-propeller repeat protein n=1 Tax=Intrasporangium calvum TaxID=53358 RepID=UPI001FD6265B|nr:cytochrome D1 domain-containing protein [Intrasporangium calvum]